jgi:peptidylamidoglycolate lyase
MKQMTSWLSGSRRSFLAAVGSGFGVPFVRGESKSAPAYHGALVGHGGFRYRVDKLWSRADAGKVPVKDCHEMVQAADGRLFLLTNVAQNNVLIYDVEGALLETWTLKLGGAHGLTLHREADGKEFLYVTDAGAGRVIKTTLAGEVVMELPKAGKCGAYKETEEYRPTETAVAPNGDIYVADGYGSQYVLRFDREGKFISKFGGQEYAAGESGAVHAGTWGGDGFEG